MKKVRYGMIPAPAIPKVKKAADFNLGNALTQGNPRLKKLTGRGAIATSVWVNTMLNRISEYVAAVPILFYNPEGKLLDPVDDKDDPLMRVLNKPWGQAIPTFQLWKKLVVLFRLLDGEVFIYPALEEEEPAFKILPGSSFKEVVDPDTGNLTGWIYTPAGTGKSNKKGEELQATDVAQWKLANPLNIYRGLSPLTAARMTLEQEYYAQGANISTLTTGDLPGLIVEADGVLGEDQEKALMKNINKFHDSIEKRNRVLILGGVKFVTRGMNPKDMQYIELRKFTREELCAVYGVPPACAGIFEYANYANSEIQDEMLFRQTTQPTTLDLAYSLIQAQLLDYHFPGYWCEPDFSNVPSYITTLNKKMDSANKLFTMGMPFAAINEGLKLELPRYDGDTIGYLFGLPVSEYIPAEDQEQETTPAQIEETEEAQTTLSVGINRSKMIQLIRSKVNTDDSFFHRYAGNVNRLIYTPFNAKFSAFYRSFLNTMGGAIAESLKDGKQKPENFSVNRKFWGGMYEDLLMPSLEELALHTMYYLKQETRAKNIISSYLKLIEGKRIPADITLEELLTASEMQALTASLQRTLSMATRAITITFADKIEDIVRDGMNEGMSVTAISNAIQEQTVAHQVYALTNAQTLTTSGYNGTRQFGFGVYQIDRHIWINMGDESVRDSHRLEGSLGKPVKVGTPFPITRLLYPGDSNGAAKEVINCRCTTVAVSPETMGTPNPTNE